MDAHYAYIALNMIGRVGPATVRSLVNFFGSVEKIFEAKADELMAVPNIKKSTVENILAKIHSIDPEQEEKKAKKIGAYILTPADKDYPEILKNFEDAPLALYVMGTLNKSDKKRIAIVGTRRPTHYGREITNKITRELVSYNFTIISGMARGIDTIAHSAAIASGGRTIAVLGGAIDHIYPPENKDLAKKIKDNGAIISEFPLGRPPDKTSFPIRNRIISALSYGVLIPEAGLTSGALITANFALEQGKSIFAIPGRIDSPASKGCHKLVKEGAKLVENVEDIIEEFQLLLPKKEKDSDDYQKDNMYKVKLSYEAEKIIQILEDGEKDVDSIIRESNLSPSKVNVALLELEMNKKIKILPGKIVELCRL